MATANFTLTPSTDKSLDGEKMVHPLKDMFSKRIKMLCNRQYKKFTTNKFAQIFDLQVLVHVSTKAVVILRKIKYSETHSYFVCLVYRKV
jgi:hypothetical protein